MSFVDLIAVAVILSAFAFLVWSQQRKIKKQEESDRVAEEVARKLREKAKKAAPKKAAPKKAATRKKKK